MLNVTFPNLDDRLWHPKMDDRNHPKLDECLHHPKMDDRNHPKFDDRLHHLKMDDWNRPKLDDYCLFLFLFYIEANELKSSKIGWLLHVMKKSSTYGWLQMVNHFWNENIPPHILTPWLSLLLTSAPWWTRNFTVSTSISLTAMCRGVHWWRDWNKV